MAYKIHHPSPIPFAHVSDLYSNTLVTKRKTMRISLLLSPMELLLWICFFAHQLSAFTTSAAPYGGPLYDSTAYSKCKAYPEVPLYNGGILKGYHTDSVLVHHNNSKPGTTRSLAFALKNLTQGTKYCFSSWVKIKGADSALIMARLTTENTTYECIGNVVAKSGCWSFLKGGFVLDAFSKSSTLFFETSDDNQAAIEVSLASPSLQPFSDEEWNLNQHYRINTERKRAVTIHVSDKHGNRLKGAQVTIDQISKEFPFGSAIASTIIGNLPYQDWFVKRFNTAVFENELKWDATEPRQGKTNYTIPDQMLEFIRSNQISVRGHNIVWENPAYIPSWVRNLTDDQLKLAVNSRIQSLMNRYKGDFIHWDVSNEMLHFDFYEQRLGADATLNFFKTAHQSDPLATLFINDYNVVESCTDINSTVDSFISRITDLKRGGISMDGIGLEAHFSVPNPPLIRGILDKLATLGLPIWLTEVDIQSTFDKQTQAVYLEQVLREGFSHPYVHGIMLWSALHSYGCYRMCLTDGNFSNLPAGDVVDKLLQEWKTGLMKVQTNYYGSYSFRGFLGEYLVNVKYGDRTVNSTFSLCKGDETRHLNIQL